MLILDGTENEVVISLCHAATISLTISSAAFYEDMAVTAACGNHCTRKSSLGSCPKESQTCVFTHREGTPGEMSGSTQGWPRGRRTEEGPGARQPPG